MELISTCLFVFMAEMGDKTQILAMTFATKYSVKEVLLGVFIGSLFNHGLAIFLGFYLSKSISLTLLQLIAACCFIIFGLLGLRTEEDHEEENVSGMKYGPITTVAIAFFIGELGDKTQLTSMTLATQGNYPVFILLGAILGMVLISSLAICVSCRVCKMISPEILKLISSYIFIIIGMNKLWGLIPNKLTSPWILPMFLIPLIFIVIHFFISFFVKNNDKKFIKTK